MLLHNQRRALPDAAIRRKSFTKFSEIIDIPNLIDIQRASFEDFLQLDVPPQERKDFGIQEIFKQVFPLESFNGNSTLEYVSYEMGTWECSCGQLKGFEHRHEYACECGLIHGVGREDGPFDENKKPKKCSACGQAAEYKRCKVCDTRPTLKLKYDVEDCKQLGLSYSAPMKTTIRLVVWDKDEHSGAKTIRDIREQQVYLGEMPLMTDVFFGEDGTIHVGSKGVFVINGTERVIVSQMHRSPGVFFGHDKGKTSTTGKILYSAKIIPYRGSWLEFEFDNNDVLHVRIDRKRKLPATVLLRALGLNSTEEILNLFYDVDKVTVRDDVFVRELTPRMRDEVFHRDILDEKGNVLFHADKKVTVHLLTKHIKEGVKELRFAPGDLVGRIVARDIIHHETGEVLVESGAEIDESMATKLLNIGVKEFFILLDSSQVGASMVETLKKDKGGNYKEAQRDIYKILRPGDPMTEESAASLFNKLFFDPKTFDLSKVGRMKIDRKLGLDIPVDVRILTKEDIFETIRFLLRLKTGSIGNEGIDDIDHLGNRRVRTIGELLQGQLRVGLLRIEKAIKERMSIQDLATATPYELINAKPITATIKEFFGSSQLSQFMDQTNPLAELTHKRRLSALGPGGLSRERAGFEVRDVHPTHYGRICPIETPEGPNVGLITSMSTYAIVDQLGFIRTPYRVVEAGHVSHSVDFLSALDEDKGKGGEVAIAQANAELDEKGRFTSERISARVGGEFIIVGPETLQYMDVSPKQLVSVSTSLIPFLEHDDANRALMGSNMQRQAVPLVAPSSPIIGTGMESIAAYDSGAVVKARRRGVVKSVSSERIIIKAEMDNPHTSGVDIYDLTKFQRSNQNTCINMKPIVNVGEKVVAGTVVADGPATQLGELALGQNILTAFMPWNGYNFEDAILISEKVVKEDMFTSIHIEEFTIEARETKLGKEEITRDIPNASEEKLRNIDECGIIRIGARVKAGDVLVGKVTPKGETQFSPEEKLLRAIFGEKAADVRDASLKVPPGTEGTIVDVKVFARKGSDRDQRMREIEQEEIEKLETKFAIQRDIINDHAKDLVAGVVNGKKLTADLSAETFEGTVTLKKGTVVTPDLLQPFGYEDLKEISCALDLEEKQNLQIIARRHREQMEVLKSNHNQRLEALDRGDELAPGVLKLVKVFIANKRKLMVGDKMAGRHGNKGVVARILPEYDMPYLPDGTPLELVLNPLGVPSRMNVGQIMEIHLGWAAGSQGIKIATPVFAGATEQEIKDELEKAGLPRSGQAKLIDGRTGLPFENEVTVGYMYIMKLAHLVDDKMHARSIGPYSLVTQQPLGGKAQFGGQRVGEMEVWALEAYGAAHTLQELLTVKSDDVAGRTRVYQFIVKGISQYEAGLPESFKVLVTELKSLALDVQLVKVRKKTKSEAAASAS